jgi:hypothetical protein
VDVEPAVTETDPEIRAFRPGDEVAINASFNEVFGRHRTMDEWSWKFPPVVEGRFIMVAARADTILAQYAGIPVRYQIDGSEWTATQIVDVFATREARGPLGRRGLWVKTVDRYFDDFGRSGRAPLLFGFPGPRHRRLGILQLGYDAMEPPRPIRYLMRTGHPSNHGVRRWRYRAELARDWEPRLDTLWERVKHQYPVAVRRDASWAVRRFAGHPTMRYHRFLVFSRFGSVPVGYAVFRATEGRLRWVDFLWDHRHPGALDLFGHLAARLAEQTGCDREDMWLTGDPDGQFLLGRHGFQEAAEPDGLVMVARAFDGGVDLDAMAERAYITLADSDLA